MTKCSECGKYLGTMDDWHVRKGVPGVLCSRCAGIRHGTIKEVEVEVVRDTHGHPKFKGDFVIWLRWWNRGPHEDANSDRMGTWDVGTKVRYEREEAIKEAREISRTLGFPLTRIDEAVDP